MNITDIIALILVIIGGLNWGLIGIFDFNLIEVLFGQRVIASFIYVLAGLSFIYSLSILLQKKEYSSVATSQVQ